MTLCVAAGVNHSVSDEVRILSAQHFCFLQANRSVVNQARTGSQYQADTDICTEIAERCVYMSCNILHTRDQTEHIFNTFLNGSFIL